MAKISNDWLSEFHKLHREKVDKILTHGFIKELYEGTLPKKKFDYYIKNDLHYSKEFKNTIDIVRGKFIKDSQEEKIFAKYIQETLDLVKFLESCENKNLNCEINPICINYEKHENDNAKIGVAEGIAAILPCFWIYVLIAKNIMRNLKNEKNPYYSYIKAQYFNDETYQEIIDICNNLAKNEENQKKMEKILEKSIDYEYQFFDMCYQI